MTTPSNIDQIERTLAAHSAKVKAREARIRKEELELERERAALVTEGCAYFDGQLNELREKAATFADAAKTNLAALPPPPVKPEPELVVTIGFDAYMAASEAFPGAVEAHQQAARAASATLGPALRGLYEQACALRRQCRTYGLRCFEGVGFLREDQRKPRPSTALIDYSRHSDLIAALADAADRGDVTAEEADALAALLREPGPAAQPVQAERIWKSVTDAAAQREAEREIEGKLARGEAVPRPKYRGEDDVERYTNGLGRTGGAPLIVPVSKP